MNRIVPKSFRIVFSSLILILFAAAAQAQFKASVEGTVTDQNGAVVTGAAVTLTSDETGRTLQTTTSSEGFYRFGSLAPGRYTLVAEKAGAGFKKVTIPNIVVNAEESQGVNITLTAGVTESVTVTSDNASVLQTENPDVTRSISTEEIRQLPQFGRDPYNLLRLTPGVFGDGARGGNGSAVNLPNTTGPGGSNNSIFQTENQVPITANGQRLSDNNFQIDGVSVNSYNWGGAAIVTPNQEAVKEIRVKSSSYSAEDGRNSGAQIQVVSQNGTNDFHGSAFLKYNSPKLNAFNKYGGPNGQAPVRVADYIRQFGGSIGGPIPLPNFRPDADRPFVSGKNKAFFFFSYEGLRNNSTNFIQSYVETPQFRQQVIQQRPNSVAAFVLSQPGSQARVVSILTPTCAAYGNDPTKCRIVGNGIDVGSLTGATGQYVPGSSTQQGGGLDGIPDLQLALIALPNQNQGNQYNARIDLTPNERNTFTLSTFLTHLNNFGSDAAAQGRPFADLPFKPFNSSGTILYTHVFSPTLLNEARFNASRFKIDQLRDAAAANVNFGIPRIEIEGIPALNGNRLRFGVAQGDGTPGIFAQNTFEFSDTATKVFGSHATKYGVVIRKEQDNSDLSFGAARPVFSNLGLFNFANDAPIFEGLFVDPRTGGPVVGHPYYRTNYYAGFGQDDWKVRPNLTLNLGVRYEYFSPLTEKFGRLSNLFIGSQGLTNAQVRVVDQLYNPDKNNFAPRVGFAYSPKFATSSEDFFGRLLNGERVVVRGGFGIAYNRIPVAPLNNARANPPFGARLGICCGTAADSFGTPFVGGKILYAVSSNNSISGYPRNPLLAIGINPTNGLPNVTDGSVEIYGTPQNLPNPYVYLYSLETQIALPQALTAIIGYQGSTGHKQIRLVNQRFIYPVNPATNAISAAYFSTPDVNTNYNALNLELRRRFTHGVQLSAYYRWSKSIDELSYEGPGFVTNQTYPQDLKSERGPSDFDVRHLFNLSGLYELPFFRGRSDFAGKALGGFLLSGILTYHTGFPFTPVVGGCTSTPGGPALCPARPQGYTGPAHPDTSNQAFMNGILGPNAAQYFIIKRDANGNLLPPGIGRNSFRGPRYFDVDMSLVKQTRLPAFVGEGANLELRANFYNVFNILNLAPLPFGSSFATINSTDFGKSPGGLAGRVVELQARFRF